MGLFDRLGNGWKMGMSSLKVIKKNKQLVLFPIVSSIALILVIASFIGILFAQVGTNFDEVISQGSIGDYILTFIYYLICYFVIIFFNVGLVHCTRIYLKGGEPTVGAGIKFAASRFSVILGWAMLSATVGLVLKAIQENSGTLGNIISGIIGVVWSVMTFFVVPVLAYEDLGPIEAFKRSSKIMKEKWGESIGASFSFGILSLAGFLLIALPIGFICSLVHPVFGIAMGVLAAFIIQSIVSAAEMVFVASVYHTVVEDQPLEDFDSDLLDDLFVKK